MIRDLYTQLLCAWNDRDATAYAALFSADGALVGFDGAQVSGAEVVDHLGPIFTDHPTAAYVAKVREIRPLDTNVIMLRAIVGMIPPGADRLKAETNAVQTLIAQRSDGEWRIVLFQNTPAQYHGRPDLTERHTAELEPLVAAGTTVA
jgi:uncharacterized protein (TIGR02246 family)